MIRLAAIFVLCLLLAMPAKAEAEPGADLLAKAWEAIAALFSSVSPLEEAGSEPAPVPEDEAGPGIIPNGIEEATEPAPEDESGPGIIPHG